MNLFIPMFFAVVVSNKVGECFTRGLYVRGTRGKQMPILVDILPYVVENIVAQQMMSTKLVVVQRVDTL